MHINKKQYKSVKGKVSKAIKIALQEFEKEADNTDK